MSHDAALYRDQFTALQPPGAALPVEPTTQWQTLLLALAEEFARLDARVDELWEAADPRTTAELIEEWESVVGLPDECTGDITLLSDRRNAVLGRLTAVGAQNRQYYIDLAARAGFVVTITETVAHTWQVNSPADTLQSARAGIAVAGTPLRLYGREAILECLLDRVKPAHTVLLFNYS